MKKFSTLMMMLMVASMSFAQVTVTINLDMNGTNYNESTEDLYYSGDINGWKTPGEDAAAKLNANGDGTYTVVLNSVMPGYTFNDFYRENQGGTGWGTNGEWSGAPLHIDQLIYVGLDDVTVNAKWGKMITAKFSVNMNGVANFNPSTDSVYFMIEDVFLNATPLTDSDANGIYSVVFDSLPQGLHLATVFAYGSLKKDAPPMTFETLDELPGLGNKRMVYLGNSDIDTTFVFGGLVGVKNELPISNVLLYPNPSNGIITIAVEGQYSAEAFDVTGKLVYSKTLLEQNNTIDFTNNPKGLYLIRVTSGNNTTAQKVIIQ